MSVVQADAPARGTRTAARHSAAPGASPRGRATPAAWTWVLLPLVFATAAALRLFDIRKAFNLFVDEVTYTQLGRSVASGGGVTLYGAPFNLHPPLVFVLLGGVIRSLGLTGPPDSLILALRPVAAVAGAAVVAVVFLLLRRLGASLPVALTGAALVAADPFQISFDSRVLLEPFAQLGCLAAVALLLLALDDRPDGTRSQRWAVPAHRWAVPAAGLAGGAAFCTKETFGLVLAVTLLATGLSRAIAARRRALVVLAIGAGVYVAVTVAIWLTSGFTPWWDAHTEGLRRLFGAQQTTGFNAPSTKVSFVSRIAANIDDFGATYLLLAAGTMAGFVQVVAAKPWRARPIPAATRARIVVALWATAAGLYLGYATLIGSLEEQMYYILLVPGLLSLVLGLRRVLPTLRRRALAVRVTSILCVLVLVFDTQAWLRRHTGDADVYEQFFSWQRTHVASGSRIGVTEDVAQFVLAGVRIGRWDTLTALEAHHADYVLVDTALVSQGYSTLTPQTLAVLRRLAVVAFSASAPGEGSLVLFDVRRLDRTTGTRSR